MCRRHPRRLGLGLALSAAMLVACAQQPPAAPAGSGVPSSTSDEARRYVAVLRWAVARTDPAPRAVRLRATRGGPRGERIARGWPAALRADIRRFADGRPHVRFGGHAASDELDLLVSTFGERDSEWFVRLAAFEGAQRRWSSDVRVVRRDGRWVAGRISP